MRMKIKLQTVIDAIEQASDAYTMLYDTKPTKRFICLMYGLPVRQMRILPN